VCPGYEELLRELRAREPVERELEERELVEREPDEREPDEREAPDRVPPPRVELLLAVELRPEEERPVDRVGALSATEVLTLSKSLSTLLLAFLASRCKFFSALVMSLYAPWALRSSPLPADCSALCASSSSFSTRCCVRSRLRRAADDDDDDDDDDDALLVERVVVLRAAGLLAAGVRAAGLRAAGFLAAGGITVSSEWGLVVTRVGKALPNGMKHVVRKLPDVRTMN
jgi:hypothetical protein